ncbi:MAG: family 16 glycoside hydrolase [Micromonosporaceae bacterium]
MTTAITIDGTKGGRTLDGVGAISGGGGNSVQLISYAEPQRSDILDFLFLPGAGAALQILKVEIGGDAFSSCGAEPSHMHSRGVVNPGGGYEWWLMREAKARNPAIRLYGLAWAAPGWIGGGDFWCQEMIEYLVSWLDFASGHGLTIDYLGGWNEQGYDCAWFKSLRKSLDASGHTSTKIVASDKDPYDWAVDGRYRPDVPWAIADDMKSDPDLAAAIAVLGAHDVCSYPTTGIQCWSTATAVASGKPLWHSEVGAMPGADGSPMIRSVIRGYIDAKMTGHIQWPLITTQPPGLYYLDRGLIWAAQPRSGYYIPKAMLGAIAAVTQFTKPGWVHIDSACGYLGGNRANGSYMALRAPDAKAWSLMVETTTATAQQNITVTIKGGLPGGTVHVWRTSPKSASPADWLLRRSDITLDANGSFTFGCLIGYVYSFTSTTGQGIITPSIPASQPFQLPYSDGWTRAASAAGTMPPYLAPQDGSFEFVPAADGSGSYVVGQTTPMKPIFWHPRDQAATRFPYAVMGTGGMASNYKVSASVCFTGSGQSGGVIARFSSQGNQIFNFRGYILDFGSAGGWWLTKNSMSVGNTVLAHGTITAPGPGKWTSLAIAVHGTTITAWVNGQQVATVTDNDPNYATGIPAIETDAFRGTWSPTQFRDFSVTPY